MTADYGASTKAPAKRSQVRDNLEHSKILVIYVSGNMSLLLWLAFIYIYSVWCKYLQKWELVGTFHPIAEIILGFAIDSTVTQQMRSNVLTTY